MTQGFFIFKFQQIKEITLNESKKLFLSDICIDNNVLLLLKNITIDYEQRTDI
jgi:hypothetical protein